MESGPRPEGSWSGREQAVWSVGRLRAEGDDVHNGGERSDGGRQAFEIGCGMTREQQEASGDDFDVAFRELFAKAYRISRRILGDPTAAEDVAAEALSRAYAHWPKICRLPYRDAWVMRVATNLALDLARRRAPRLTLETSESHDDATATRLALVDALRALPIRQREVIVLRYLGDMSEPEIAERLGLSLGSVKTHLRRGKHSLRDRTALGLLGGEA